jgi:hypothetical protein
MDYGWGPNGYTKPPEAGDTEIEVHLWLKLSPDELAVIKEDMDDENPDDFQIMDWLMDTVDTELGHRVR